MLWEDFVILFFEDYQGRSKKMKVPLIQSVTEAKKPETQILPPTNFRLVFK